MNASRTWLLRSLIVLYSFAVVFFLREQMMTGLDPGNFLAAIEHGLDTLAARPHAPGYPLFVLLWKAMHSFGLDPETAIYFTNAMWTSIGLIALHALAMRIEGDRVAMFALLFAALNPLVLFYSSTGEIYVYDLAFSSALMLAANTVQRKGQPLVWLALGIAGGFRLSSIMLMYPVMLVLLLRRRKGVRSIVLSHGMLAVGMLLWLIPFTFHEGGIDQLILIWRATALLEGTVLQSGATWASALVWMLHLALPLVLLLPLASRKIDPRYCSVLILWLVVPTLFFIFKFYAKGYILLTLPAFAIVLGVAIEGMGERVRRALTYAIPTFGVLCFFLVPFKAPSVQMERSASMSDRLQTAALRTTSWFSATNAHLRYREDCMEEAMMLIKKNVPFGSSIRYDGSISLWAHPRTLEYHLHERYALKKMPIQDAVHQNVWYLCPNEIAELDSTLAHLEPIERNKTISLYRITP